MSQVSIKISTSSQLMIRTVAGKPVNLEVGKLSPEVVARIFEAGAKVILTNAFNGGGKAVSEGEKLGQMQKRMDAWYRGEFVVVERESASTALREAFMDERRAATGATVKQVEESIAAAVKAAFGDKEKATFGRFLDALALQLAPANGITTEEARERLEAKYAKLAQEAAERRDAAAAKLDLSGISL